MQIILTLDYELFMGSSTGTVDKCLVEPMRRLCQAIEPAQGRFTIFVDACYLLKLQEYSSVYNRAASDLNMITSHLRQLSDAGHDLQLHIHPHWWFSTFDGMRWNVNSSYYKMSDVPDDTLLEMFRAAKALLDHLTPEEADQFRRGRNAHTNHKAKNATESDYHFATGLEAVFGWLYLRGDIDRLRALFALIEQAWEKGDNDHEL